MRLGIISGTGTYAWPGLQDAAPQVVDTRYGSVAVTEGRAGGCDLVHLSRHGSGHARLSNHVNHRANLAALLRFGVDGVVALTACGAVDPALSPGSLVVFDDLYFPANRLPDGSPCTWYDEPGDPRRGHWIFDRPFSEPLRQALLAGSADVPVAMVDRGCYGHVDGPRFNSKSEIAALATCGVSAVSQTAGPETVLAGEAELPLALLGLVTDYANGVAEPTPLAELLDRINSSAAAFAAAVSAALPHLGKPHPTGSVYRFEQ